MTSGFVAAILSKLTSFKLPTLVYLSSLNDSKKFGNDLPPSPFGNAFNFIS